MRIFNNGALRRKRRHTVQLVDVQKVDRCLTRCMPQNLQYSTSLAFCVEVWTVLNTQTLKQHPEQHCTVLYCAVEFNYTGHIHR